MSEMNLLLVEDQEQDQASCISAVDDFKTDNDCVINLKVCSNVEDALSELKERYYDGAIIDIRLAGQGDEGNQVIEQIKRTFGRIPVVIMTGTPDAAEKDGFPLVDLHKKGEVTYIQIIESLWGIYRTGLTKIMGGSGEVEKNLSKIFIENLLPQRERWIAYGEEDPERTEKALLRHALNHLMQILDDDVGICYPEEFYVFPSVSTRINTGSVVKDKESGNFCITMNPACDLAERKGGDCNTDRALLVEIQTLSDVFSTFDWENLSKNNIKELEKAYKNNKANHYHWLPKTQFYDGGLINFRRISTYTESELDKNFEFTGIQVSPAFIKDMVSRFSSYYARQGQPDIDHEKVQI